MKKFSEFQEEMMTAADAGIPADTKDAMPKKKRKKSPLTRRYIEVAGRLRKREK